MAVDAVVADLRRIEHWLTAALGVAVDDAERRENPDPSFPTEELDKLKKTIDRIRPLLWVYLTRQNEADLANQRKTSSGARTLMEDAIAISDRYVGKDK